LQRLVTDPVVEQEGNRVAQDLPQQPSGQMPEVPGPYPLYVIAPRQLRENGVDAVTKAAEEGAPLGIGVVLLGAVGRQKLYAFCCGQLFPLLGRPVVAIPDGEPAPSGLDELGQHGKLVGVGRGYREAGDHPGPAHPHVYPEAVEGLFEQGIFAESGFSFEAAAAVGAGEQACWQGHRVYQRESGVVRGKEEQFLPEMLLDLPEVGCLTGEGGAVDIAESGEPLGVVAPKEEMDALVGVYAEELADHFYGEDLRVGELGGGSAASDAPKVLELVV
jgi:hypothetical protein